MDRKTPIDEQRGRGETDLGGGGAGGQRAQARAGQRGFERGGEEGHGAGPAFREAVR